MLSRRSLLSGAVGLLLPASLKAEVKPEPDTLRSHILRTVKGVPTKPYGLRYKMALWRMQDGKRTEKVFVWHSDHLEKGVWITKCPLWFGGVEWRVGDQKIDPATGVLSPIGGLK
jgi:hypothetical protein